MIFLAMHFHFINVNDFKEHSFKLIIRDHEMAVINSVIEHRKK